MVRIQFDFLSEGNSKGMNEKKKDVVCFAIMKIRDYMLSDWCDFDPIKAFYFRMEY